MEDSKSEVSNRGWEVGAGIVLTIIGVLAIVSSIFTTFLSVLFVGWLLIIGGLVAIFAGLFSGHLSTALLGLFGGALNLIIGFVMVSNPGLSAATITLLIAVMLLVVGAYRAIASLFQRNAGWGWTLTWGVLTFLLGAVVWQQFPVSGLWVIGFFIGIEFLLLGIKSLFGFGEESAESRESAYA